MDIQPNATTQSDPLLSYTIRCSQHGRIATFLPQRQLFSLIESFSQTQVDLGFSPSRLLELLIKSPDLIVTRQEILEYAWPKRIVTQNSLNQAISKLRELLGDEQDKQIIQTVPRQGYRFNSNFLVATNELDRYNCNTQTTPQQEFTSTLTRNAFLFNRKAPVSPLLALAAVLMLSSLIWRADWDLLLKPDLLVDTEQEKNQIFTYTAPDSTSLKTLKSDVAILRERLVSFSSSSETLIFNRAQDYYDIVCVNQEIVKFISLHHSRLATVDDQQLQDCLK
ncbi:winged helix-turn-helix domain-containing protein [Pseudomonas sp. NFIX28]|uniref:winged helix-turn-helix domain-containing protein n=1 Tax=Pseudomonas sp. NFIX28 TaxID=1566235 RepID=UPI0008986F9C|nr:winged helix-turn-helix domain-containing protein [Pseudomonas sp. NFIX28]SDY37715.1 DNA-binding winged helix-turn-helix (wHTH) domain-containing protein [Pseudomonas sp. NFIX28]